MGDSVVGGGGGQALQAVTSWLGGHIEMSGWEDDQSQECYGGLGEARGIYNLRDL